MIILAGDIGGTNSRLLLTEVRGSERQDIAEKIYPSNKFLKFTDILKLFLSEHHVKKPVDSACFAVAGPVQSGVSSITNLPWVINETDLSTFLQGATVKLINDFIAVAYAVPTLKENDILVLHQGDNDSPNKNSKSAAVIGAGTGLGAAHLVYLNERYHALSSEAGHSGFAPANQLQTELLSWMQNDHDHVSLELLLSGRGLHTLYRFLHEVKGISEADDVKKAMLENDPAQVISEYALANNDLLSTKALECFVDIYGAAAGNIALHYFPLDEVYIAGGIALKIRNKLTQKRFINAFNNKGLMTENMKNVTVKLILESKVGLYGALNYIMIT